MNLYQTQVQILPIQTNPNVNVNVNANSNANVNANWNHENANGKVQMQMQMQTYAKTKTGRRIRDYVRSVEELNQSFESTGTIDTSTSTFTSTCTSTSPFSVDDHSSSSVTSSEKIQKVVPVSTSGNQSNQTDTGMIVDGKLYEHEHEHEQEHRPVQSNTTQENDADMHIDGGGKDDQAQDDIVETNEDAIVVVEGTPCNPKDDCDHSKESSGGKAVDADAADADADADAAGADAADADADPDGASPNEQMKNFHEMGGHEIAVTIKHSEMLKDENSNNVKERNALVSPVYERLVEGGSTTDNKLDGISNEADSNFMKDSINLETSEKIEMDDNKKNIDCHVNNTSMKEQDSEAAVVEDVSLDGVTVNLMPPTFPAGNDQAYAETNGNTYGIQSEHIEDVPKVTGERIFNC